MYRHTYLATSEPVRAKLGGTEKNLPLLKFAPPMEGVFDVAPTGTPTEQAAWLRQLAEAASDLAIRVERHAAQVEALATYPEAVGA